jgi:glycosyltransferase involved in cell wall biosynthesis
MHKKMKIIQILNSPNWSGASNYCISVSKELITLGHQVLLLTEPGMPAFKAKEAGIPIDTTIRLNHRNPALYVQAMKRMKHIFRSFKPDIISAHINEGAWMAGMIARLFTPDAVVSRVRTDIDPPKGHFINRYVHHQWTDFLVVGSMLHKRLCHEILDLDNNRIDVVYGGVDSDRFRPEKDLQNLFRQEIKADADELLIGLVARLDPVKGHEYALQAMKILQNTRVKCRLVALGYENERTFAWLHELADSLAIGDKVVSFDLRKDLPQVLSSLDIGLITSIGSEANSRAALEFMASGKPVVGTSVGVIPELIADGEQGFIVRPKDAGHTAAALKKLLENPLLRSRLGKNARQRVEENFSLEKFGKVMANIYSRQLLQNKMLRH